MKALTITILMTGCIAFWSLLVFRADLTAREEARAETAALNYAQFRSAVFAHALEVKSAGAIFSNNPNLRLPQGWRNIRDWRGLVQQETDGRLYCYVYGPARPEEVAAVQKLFNQNLTVGWNDAGVLTRNSHPLPSAIPDRNIVSVIRLD